MIGLNTKYAFRDQITQGFREHLLGPKTEDEILVAQPCDVYSVGMLHPLSKIPEEVQIDDVAIGGVDVEEVDEPTTLANLRFPSTMGLTFAVKGKETSELAVSVRVGVYKFSGHDWQRSSILFSPKPVKIQPTDGFEVVEVCAGLELRFRIRKADIHGHIAMTLVLVNTKDEVLDRKLRSESVFFQPEIIVEIPVETDVSFVDRSQVPSSFDDKDSQLSRLLFRHTRNYATGHGCAVDWKNELDEKKLFTTFLPEYDLRLAESNPAIDSWVLDMRAPAKKQRDEVVKEFSSLVTNYEGWIESQQLLLVTVPVDLRDVAEANIAECRRSASRMRRGISVLSDSSDMNPFRAFVYMSEAMVEQRIRSEIVLANRSDLNPAEIPAKWRPFQLMFILQSLEGLANIKSEDREIADLLWFPTGGGKTEAYLGLIAFTLMLRRLRKKPHGVSAIMRYTLRLLTTQQFERAALLMCCCEDIRKRNGDLGSDHFEVGLFIGRNGTPNTLENAKKALKILRDNADADVSKFGNPIQINICVWCGSKLGPFDHIVGEQCVAKCPDSACQFSSRLPWLVVDEDLYSRRPNLVIGTVDKFALLAIKEETGNLFNRMAGQTPGLDLIIQDELHLISGPLGTLTGLYESAIDEIGRQNSEDGNAIGPRPKIIASTATIRRATEQVRSVFDREVCQFPPSALDSRDSYFAVESLPEKKGTRRYLGVMAPELSQSTLLVRTYASLFHEVSLGDWDDSVRDIYWTLVAYFNSLRILAAAQLLMLDDVSDRLDLLNGGGAHIRQPGDNKIELTSRASATDIPKYLRQLRVGIPDSDTVQTLLATNMISVGVDIDRLGLMVLAGQPQGTAEYIQASSRVGRRDPGLVITVYNSTRSRDRSQYESFLPYHSALYRRVEATSVTPFSPRARQRALHAVFVILCRHLVPDLQSNNAAKNILHHLSEIDVIKDLLIARVSRVDQIEANDTRHELEDFISDWCDMARNLADLKYYKSKDPNVLFVSHDEFEDEYGGPLPVLMSMRDVDKSCSLYEASGRNKRVTR